MKKIILTGITSAALAFSASAEVKVGNPMAVTGPIPDLVAPMLLAVDLAEKHVNEQGGLFADCQKYTIVRADSGCDPTAAVDADEIFNQTESQFG